MCTCMCASRESICSIAICKAGGGVGGGQPGRFWLHAVTSGRQRVDIWGAVPDEEP